MDTASVIDAIDELATRWSAERDDRLSRRHLDPADFEEIAATGYLRLIVPESHGGLWSSLAESGPVVIDAVRRLARGDQSVALVAAMHPAVQIFFTASPSAPAPFTEVWADQRADVFRSALDGHFWGTMASEPGSGGDIMRTKATATSVDDAEGRYRLQGAKHFGSGSGVVSYMITIAKPDGSENPIGLYMDLRDQTWDGTQGITITREWDGMGMKATQSHASMLHGVEATAWAWPLAIADGAPIAGSFVVAMFCTVAAAVVDAAMAEAELRLGDKALRPYEEVAWTQAQVDHWMLAQAETGLIRTIATQPPQTAAVAAGKAKLGMAALAESILSNVSRAVGGGAFSSSSPFASWYEDVRALGYLRPPWALAFDQLIEARQATD